MSTSTSTVGPMLCAHCGRPMASSVQVGGMMYHAECTQSPYAASPQPAAQPEHRQGCDALGGYGQGVGPCSCGAQPEQPEPGVLTDERLWELAWASGLDEGGNVRDPAAFARAIEREVLSTTRKRSDAEVARIMEAVDRYASIAIRGSAADYTNAELVDSAEARAEVERLLGGEA